MSEHKSLRSFKSASVSPRACATLLYYSRKEMNACEQSNKKLCKTIALFQAIASVVVAGAAHKEIFRNPFSPGNQLTVLCETLRTQPQNISHETLWGTRKTCHLRSSRAPVLSRFLIDHGKRCQQRHLSVHSWPLRNVYSNFFQKSTGTQLVRPAISRRFGKTIFLLQYPCKRTRRRHA